MRILGLEISRARKKAATLSSVSGRGGWWPLIREPWTGAWQRNREISPDTALAYHAVWACVTLIASDVGKLRQRYMERSVSGIWTEVKNPDFSPVLRKPNHYQNHIQFKAHWLLSKLMRGNTYALKVRGDRGTGNVLKLYILDPTRVQTLVAPDGQVFYQLQGDNLSGLEEAITVPASEIIHDRGDCLFHPLVGVSPIYASAMAASVGMSIEQNADSFFEQGSNPSGILTGPLPISPEQAALIAERWNQGYSGENSGKVAVVGSDLKFQPLRMSAVDAQMIEHLRWTAETVCSTFHVPPFKVGIGQMPTYQNGETLTQIYYTDCLQSHIESYEAALDEGLGLDGEARGVDLDLRGLLRMDQKTHIETLGEGVGRGIYAPNEARAEIDLPPVAGGASPMVQQQNYSLAALDKRDNSDDPFGTSNPTPPAPAPPAEPDTDERSVQGVLAMRFRAAAKQKRATVQRRKAA